VSRLRVQEGEVDHFGIPKSAWLDPKATALLVVDVQKYAADHRYDVTRYHPFAGGADRDGYFRRVGSVVLPCIRELLRFFRDSARPVLFLRYCTHDLALKDMPLLWQIASRGLKDAAGRPYSLTPDAEATQIMTDVQPLPAEAVLDKTTNGGFASTKLDIYLRNYGSRSLVITGGWTQACVESTVREAADRGYLCTVVSDGTFAPTEDLQKHSLDVIHGFFGQALSCQEVIGALGGLTSAS
jgi:nicotinamidase-related amidase